MMEKFPGRHLFTLLAKRGCLPRKVQLTRVGQSYYANVYNKVSSDIISHSVCTGFSRSADTAILIALVEFMERRGYSEAWRRNELSVVDNSTDGLAAYPIFGSPQIAARAARANAIKEAIERYTWASWWDSLDLEFECWFYSPDNTPSTWPVDLVSIIRSHTPVSRFILIRPQVTSCTNFIVSIIFAELQEGGFLSGGACEHIKDEKKASRRALAELTRHALGLSRVKAKAISPNTFYEKRLAWFGRGFGDELVRKRITTRGSLKLSLPYVKVDCAIDHSNSDLINIHRFLFQNQPEFVGGALERLCL